MNGRPIRRNKAAFLNFYGVVRVERARNGGLYKPFTAPFCVCVANRVIFVVYNYVHVTARALSVRSICEMQS